ncbi:MAG: hypothetical protein AB9915_00005 [Candidatus Dojkabacteria bacterium]
MNIKTEKEKDEKEKGKEKKEEKLDERLKDLDKDILEKFTDAKINTLEMIFNLTETDLKNLKITKKEQDTLEAFAKDYLNKSK